MAQIQRVLDCVIRALAPVLPERATAGNAATVMSTSYSGIEPGQDQYWVCVEVNEGSYGARATKDGLDSVDNLMANTRNVPVEEIEMRFPLRVERYELRDEEPGAGTFRGRRRRGTRYPLPHRRVYLLQWRSANWRHLLGYSAGRMGYRPD